MKELRQCPACGYGRGFHVSLFAGENDEHLIRLICPNCGQSYDAGWHEKDIRGSQISKGPIYS